MLKEEVALAFVPARELKVAVGARKPEAPMAMRANRVAVRIIFIYLMLYASIEANKAWRPLGAIL